MIEQFRGEHFFLSNMKPLKYTILTNQNTYALTSEHAYQAAKFTDTATHQQVAHMTVQKRALEEEYDGIAAKNFAHELIEAGEPLRVGWGNPMKLAVMEEVVRRKFIANPDLLDMLIATGDELLVEGNDWGDHFWGVDPIGSDNGENHLGLILMHVREKLRKQLVA
ncbi:MAG: Swarming motility protein YbiA [Candidatus Saccharibacteria bacterium]|nr:Swarming motility protein YbiA [Candidatus Saccharibacteria bacterium]